MNHLRYPVASRFGLEAQGLQLRGQPLGQPLLLIGPLLLLIGPPLLLIGSLFLFFGPPAFLFGPLVLFSGLPIILLDLVERLVVGRVQPELVVGELESDAKPGTDPA